MEYNTASGDELIAAQKEQYANITNAKVTEKFGLVICPYIFFSIPKYRTKISEKLEKKKLLAMSKSTTKGQRRPTAWTENQRRRTGVDGGASTKTLHTPQARAE